MAVILYSDLLVRFMNGIDASDKTKHTYTQGARYFLEWMKHWGINEPTRENALQFKRYLVDYQRYKQTTVTTYLTSCRALFNWMESEGIYNNIFAGVKGTVTSRTHRKRAVTAEDMRKVMQTFDTTKSVGRRDYAIANLAARTGLRTIELQRADVEDIDFVDGQRVLWVHGKGHTSKDEFVVLTDESWEPIELYLNTRPYNSEVLFNREDVLSGCGERLSTKWISKTIKKHLTMAGMTSDRYTAHSLRHTAVTLALKGGANIMQVQKMARHSNINTTMIYAHDIGRVENAAERAVEF